MQIHSKVFQYFISSFCYQFKFLNYFISYFHRNVLLCRLLLQDRFYLIDVSMFYSSLTVGTYLLFNVNVIIVLVGFLFAVNVLSLIVLVVLFFVVSIFKFMIWVLTLLITKFFFFITVISLIVWLCVPEDNVSLPFGCDLAYPQPAWHHSDKLPNNFLSHYLPF